MTPAQLDSLLTQHRRVNDPKGRGSGGSSAPETGSVSDLFAFARMRTA